MPFAQHSGYGISKLYQEGPRARVRCDQLTLGLEAAVALRPRYGKTQKLSLLGQANICQKPQTAAAPTTLRTGSPRSENLPETVYHRKKPRGCQHPQLNETQTGGLQLLQIVQARYSVYQARTSSMPNWYARNWEQ